MSYAGHGVRVRSTPCEGVGTGANPVDQPISIILTSLSTEQVNGLDCKSMNGGSVTHGRLHQFLAAAAREEVCTLGRESQPPLQQFCGSTTFKSAAASPHQSRIPEDLVRFVQQTRCLASTQETPGQHRHRTPPLSYIIIPKS